MLEWVTISFSRGSSLTQGSNPGRLTGGFFTPEPAEKTVHCPSINEAEHALSNNTGCTEEK